jgi:predicted nucleic acid-binding protein
MGSEALVDSCVYISLMRAGREPAAWLGRHFEDLYTCGMVRLEVLRGQREPKSHDLLAEFFDVMCNVPSDNKIWEDAAELAWKMDRRGQRIPGTDALIAACALRAQVPILTEDKHFDFVPNLVVIRFYPAV